MIRFYPEVGDSVMTLHGIEQVREVDQQLDIVLTDIGNTYGLVDILMTDPPRGGSVADVEKWLDGNAYIVVTSVNLICSCLCNNCNMLVVTRGAEVTRTHQNLNGGCSCSSISSSGSIVTNTACHCIVTT